MKKLTAFTFIVCVLLVAISALGDDPSGNGI